MERTLTINWGTSRGRYTYGYTTATMYENGRRVASVNGGGYDMRGAVFAEWLNKTYGSRYFDLDLEPADKDGRIHSRKFYGLSHYVSDKGKPVRYIDGACGFDTVRRLCEAIGINVRLIDAGKNRDLILVTDTREKAAV